MPEYRRVARPGGELVLAIDVDPQEVVSQPGDLSVATAPKRARRIAAAERGGHSLALPYLRLNAAGRLEVWDGNARVEHFRNTGRRFNAIIVDPQGRVLRSRNPTVPTEPELYDQLVAEVRALVDGGRMDFKWPSEGAMKWVLREYQAQGGRWQRPRAPRPRPARDRDENKLYQELYADMSDAEDQWELGLALVRARDGTLREFLVAVLEAHAADRARILGFDCPARESCADALVADLEARQGDLFANPPRRRRLR